MLIGITGYKRCGKNTVAEYFRIKYGFNIYSFADPIKAIAKSMFLWSDDYMENRKELVDDSWGISPRQAFQIIGNEFAQYVLPQAFPQYGEVTGRLLWVTNLFRRIGLYSDVCISDVRYQHEVDAIQDREGKIIKVVRDSVLPTDVHESESYIPEIKADYIIYNNGTLEELELEIEQCFFSLIDVGSS